MKQTLILTEATWFLPNSFLIQKERNVVVRDVKCWSVDPAIDNKKIILHSTLETQNMYSDPFYMNYIGFCNQDYLINREITIPNINPIVKFWFSYEDEIINIRTIKFFIELEIIYK